MRRPRALRSGDCVGLVAPGRKVGYQNVETATNTFTSWGLRVVFAPNLFSEDHSYLGSTDAKRSADLQMMLDDVKVQAIICVRGGYGTTRIIDQIDFTKFLETPKWVVGFSDITALHLKIIKLGIESIHGTMPVLFDNLENASSIASLRDVLFGNNCILSSASLTPNRHGVATGHVLGGNLSLLVDSLGTSSEPILDARILIIEEIGEPVYKVDRMLTQLKRAGKLDKLAGLVVGHMTSLTEGELPFGETLEKIVFTAVGRFDYPVAFGFPIGHESPNLAWIHGSLMTLRVDMNGSSLSPASPV